MKLADWKTSRRLTWARLAELLELDGAHAGSTLRRIALGRHGADAGLIARVEALTGGAVAAADFHRARMDHIADTAPRSLPDAALLARLRERGASLPVHEEITP
ncbi:hypothetical protein [Oricola thermophila]|uniref:Uncharacterized protein n=1 Tax=Oricola thermophila TaxID=2742145 RepID=A0A6N1VHF8_9HYPH|nr:hypothetical protein [Oricola thermophila]QKV18742.1 hypothetical protein HTY61_09915 [Oricola thermophila]